MHWSPQIRDKFDYKTGFKFRLFIKLNDVKSDVLNALFKNNDYPAYLFPFVLASL